MGVRGERARVTAARGARGLWSGWWRPAGAIPGRRDGCGPADIGGTRPGAARSGTSIAMCCRQEPGPPISSSSSIPRPTSSSRRSGASRGRRHRGSCAGAGWTAGHRQQGPDGGARSDLVPALARRSGGWLGFEASVGGGVPMVRTLRHALAGQPVRGFRGILNGTANYVLTRLEAGDDLSAAGSLRRRSGDWRRRIPLAISTDGMSPTSWRSWPGSPGESIPALSGLIAPASQGMPPPRFGPPATAGGRLRLVGECRQGPSGLTASVRPEVVPAGTALGRAVDEQNHLEIDLGWGAPVSLSGPGAGGKPTAAALWSDLVDAAVAS